MKQQKKTKGIILNGLKLLITIASVFIIAIATQEISQKISLSPIETEPQQSQVERQTEVPAGYTGIYDADGLKAMADDLAGKYILMADIDMTGVEWTPIGNNSNAFIGTLDGNGYTISNLKVESNAINSETAMFRVLGKDGIIENLILNNININDTLEYTGSLIKGTTSIGGLVVHNYGMINNVKITADIPYISHISHKGTVYSGSLYLGGLVAYNYGMINNSEVYAFVVNDGYRSSEVGGLAGRNYGTINNSCATGTLQSGNDRSNIVGGLVGYNNTGSISNCYSNVNITVKADNGITGGLVGKNNAIINKSYSIGNVTATIMYSSTNEEHTVGRYSRRKYYKWNNK